MGVIARNDEQITLIYSSNTRNGKQTLSYLTGIDEKYLAIDLAKSKVSDTEWAEIAEALNVEIGDLVDTRELDVETGSTTEFNADDWLKIIQHNDFVISKPIVVNGDITRQISNPTEILEFFDVDSAGLEQSPLDHSEPDIKPTSGNDTFIEK